MDSVFSYKVAVYTYHHGNNVGNSIYVWKVDETDSETEISNHNYLIRVNLKSKLQVYYTRAMKSSLLKTMELYLGNVKKTNARVLLKEMFDDSSSSENMTSKSVEQRVELMIELGDPDIITDLRRINEGRPEKYCEFWDYAKKFLENKSKQNILAVDE